MTCFITFFYASGICIVGVALYGVTGREPAMDCVFSDAIVPICSKEIKIS